MTFFTLTLILSLYSEHFSVFHVWIICMLFNQIKPEQALAALESKMELDELEVWRKNLEKKIEIPTEKYK